MASYSDCMGVGSSGKTRGPTNPADCPIHEEVSRCADTKFLVFYLVLSIIGFSFALFSRNEINGLIGKISYPIKSWLSRSPKELTSNFSHAITQENSRYIQVITE